MLFLDLTPAEAKHFDGFYAEFELVASQIGIEKPKGYYEIVFCAAVWDYQTAQNCANRRVGARHFWRTG